TRSERGDCLPALRKGSLLDRPGYGMGRIVDRGLQGKSASPGHSPILLRPRRGRSHGTQVLGAFRESGSLSLTIFLDTDFLSAFLKIEQLHLVKDFYGVEVLRIPVAVYREVGLTNLLPRLASLQWVEVATPDTEGLGYGPDWLDLGKGEREAIQLSLSSPGSLLLMNDLKARRIAHRIGVETVDVPAFLL